MVLESFTGVKKSSSGAILESLSILLFTLHANNIVQESPKPVILLFDLFIRPSQAVYSYVSYTMV